MFSGKSTELIRRLKRYQIARYNCLIVKYAKDVRYDKESIATHDKQTLNAVSADKLKDLKVEFDDFDVIGIDEGQFFPDLVEFCENMANAGKAVIVAALDGTFQRKGFGPILELIPLAEHVVKLNAVCMVCFGEGSYTKRISADKEVCALCTIFTILLTFLSKSYCAHMLQVCIIAIRSQGLILNSGRSYATFGTKISVFRANSGCLLGTKSGISC